MTEKLYDKDAYISSFCAKVVECSENKDGYRIVLDKTAFFPEGGGQKSDTGKIGNVNIYDVREENGRIYHFADGALCIGEEYECTLDFEARFRKMQNHSGEHIVSGLIHSLFGFDNVGFHLGSQDVTMDYNGILTRDDILKIEYFANKACSENLDIIACYPMADELKNMQYRSKLSLSENVRIVEIPGYDRCACCAPHVKKTGEIGFIKLLDFIKYKGGVRIHMKCGFDALDDYNEKYRNVSETAQRLSVKQSEVSEAVKRLEGELSDKKRECAELMKKLILSKLEAKPPCEGNLIIFEDGLDADTQRAAANFGKGRCSGIFGIFSGDDKGGYRYILASENVKLVSFVKENIKLTGGGGGSDEMMQGMYKCTRAEIEKAFS